MLVIIGAYRGTSLVARSLESLKRLTGITDLAVVDDSGKPATSRELRDMVSAFGYEYGLPDVRRYPAVIEAGGKGYWNAMQAVTHYAAAGAHRSPRFMFWEEDFALLPGIDAPVDLVELDRLLALKPDLAQIALLREPWFPIERHYGGLLPALVARLGEHKVQLRSRTFEFALIAPESSLVNYGKDPGEKIETVEYQHSVTYWEQQGTFTCNPAVWQAGVARLGWPVGAHSEDRQRDRLLAKGYRFAFLDGVRLTHDGIRSGTGY